MLCFFVFWLFLNFKLKINVIDLEYGEKVCCTYYAFESVKLTSNNLKTGKTLIFGLEVKFF